MKKTIAAIALMTSANLAVAMPRPPDPNAPKPVLKTICLKTYTDNDGSVTLASCDSARNNKVQKKELLANGCAEGQSAIRTYNNIAIGACMPPGVVQL
ncbi:MAG: hypothetical protein ABL930_04865 [Pseudobdellovibrio sp.]